MTARAAAVTVTEGARAHVRAVAPLVRGTGLFRPSEVDIAVEVFTGAVEQPGVDYHALVAVDDDGALVGFTCYGPTPGTVGTWDLYWIAVDAAHQRRGVGAQLLDAAESRIRDAGGRLIVVETSSRADYDGTRAFYGSRGYQQAARIRGYYAPHDDLIAYTKELSHG